MCVYVCVRVCVCVCARVDLVFGIIVAVWTNALCCVCFTSTAMVLYCTGYDQRKVYSQTTALEVPCFRALHFFAALLSCPTQLPYSAALFVFSLFVLASVWAKVQVL